MKIKWRERKDETEEEKKMSEQRKTKICKDFHEFKRNKFEGKKLSHKTFNMFLLLEFALKTLIFQHDTNNKSWTSHIINSFWRQLKRKNKVFNPAPTLCEFWSASSYFLAFPLSANKNVSTGKNAFFFIFMFPDSRRCLIGKKKF